MNFITPSVHDFSSNLFSSRQYSIAHSLFLHSLWSHRRPPFLWRSSLHFLFSHRRNLLPATMQKRRQLWDLKKVYAIFSLQSIKFKSPQCNSLLSFLSFSDCFCASFGVAFSDVSVAVDANSLLLADRFLTRLIPHLENFNISLSAHKVSEENRKMLDNGVDTTWVWAEDRQSIQANLIDRPTVKTHSIEDCTIDFLSLFTFSNSSCTIFGSSTSQGCRNVHKLSWVRCGVKFRVIAEGNRWSFTK